MTDVAHGVLWNKDDLYLTISPDIWRLRDTNGDGVIDTKESLAHGSGVHIGFGGHGHSGPIIGPDGRLYWKQGDLGVNITTRDGRQLYNPNSGVILRANPTAPTRRSSRSGLRNPQEFAFDEYGNLISPDNDGDHPGETRAARLRRRRHGQRLAHQLAVRQVRRSGQQHVQGLDGREPVQAALRRDRPRTSRRRSPRGTPVRRASTTTRARRSTTRGTDYFFSAVFTGTPAGASIQGFTLAPQGAGFRLASKTTVVKGGLAHDGREVRP